MTDEQLLAEIIDTEAVSVTEMVSRLGWRPTARRCMRQRLKRLVKNGLLQSRPRDTISGRGGRVIFWKPKIKTADS